MFIGGTGGSSSSGLLPAGRETAALQVNPADIPGLEIKLGALVVLLSITLLFGFAPLCIVRGAGPCCVDSGKESSPGWAPCDPAAALHVGLTPDVGLADVRRRALSLISCFAGGVFLATCLLGLLPDYLQGISEAFSNAGIKVRVQLQL